MNNTIKYTCLLTFFFVFLIAHPDIAAASREVNVDESLNNIIMGKNLYYLEDPSGKLTISDIRSTRYDGLWVKSNSDTLGFGYSRSAYWVRFSIINSTGENRDIYLEQAYPLIDKLYLYVFVNTAREEFKTGDLQPFYSRPYEHRTFVFPLKIQAKSTATCYMRYETTSSINIELTLWSPAAFNKHRTSEMIFLWVFYGGMLILFFYNLIQFIFIRDRIYFFATLYILAFSLLMMSLNGLSFQYLWPESIWWANNNIPIWIYLLIFSMLLYLRDYTRLNAVAKPFDRMMVLFFTGNMACLIIFLATGSYKFGIISGLLLGVIAVMSAHAVALSFIFHKVVLCRFYSQGRLTRLFNSLFKPASPRLFILAIITYSPFSIGMLTFILKTYGILAPSVITDNAMQISGLVNVTLLSVAVSDKINVYKNELKDVNLHLEEKISERTEELQTANEELEAMNETLIMTNRSLEDARNIARIDMDMAVHIQSSVYPKTAPRTDEWDAAFAFRPLTGVSGDVFDFYLHDGALKGILMMDVSGHGIASGLLAMIARSVMLRNFTTNYDETLSSIIEKSSRDLIEEIGETDKYITGILLRLNNDTVEYVNAAHPDIFMKDSRTGEVTPVHHRGEEFKGVLLGIKEMTSEYATVQFRMKKNDTILLYTDCLIESKNSLGQNHHDEEYLRHSFASAPDSSAADILNHLLENYNSFMGDAVPTDDLTAIVLKRLV